MNKSDEVVGTPKSTPPTSDSRNYLKKMYKNFWDNYIFKYRFSTQRWYELYTGGFFVEGYLSMRVKQVVEEIPIKLWLENRITKEEQEQLEKMLKSSDKENAYIAINIMKLKAKGKM